jgi:pilus assembly protein Flp/PilA
VKDFAADSCGTTAIEYAVIGSLVSIVIVTSLTTIGAKLSSNFNDLLDGFR